MKKLLLATAALTALALTAPAHADDTKAYVRMNIYSAECGPLPDVAKLALFQAAENLDHDQIAPMTADVLAEFEQAGRSQWCAVFKQVIDRILAK